jgi:hypothetical protein
MLWLDKMGFPSMWQALVVAISSVDAFVLLILLEMKGP